MDQITIDFRKSNKISICGKFGFILSLNPSPKREIKYQLRTGIPRSVLTLTLKEKSPERVSVRASTEGQKEKASNYR